MAKLKIRDEHGKERLHELIDEITWVGRASSNTIQITDDKSSRQHFKIEKRGIVFKLVDHGSTNGTKLNGSRIGKDLELKPGDQISVGKTTFTFEDESKPKAAPAPAAQPEIGGETVAMDAVDSSEVKIPAPAATPEDNAPKYVLKMLEGKTPGKVFELGVAALTIGRHTSNTIQIVDDATSNYHAEIGREPIGYVLTDLGSTNGTRVKMKSKTDFEKIIKTPLSVGMQIRVGKTLLEFENLGKPVEDEALFGTVTLDPQKLEQALATSSLEPAPRKSNKLLGGIAAAAVLAFIAVVAIKLRPKPEVTNPTDIKPVATAPSGIPNGDFEEGPDDMGNPKKFKVRKAAPNVRVEITPDAQSGQGKGKFGLAIGKSGAKNPSKSTIVETEETLSPVDTGKVYEFTGFAKNDVDGVFGLYVRWMSGDRAYSECPVIMQGSQPEWRELKAKLSPPPWAHSACFGVMAQGSEGRAYFDQLDLKVLKDLPTPAPTVSFGGVTVAFEGTKGSFTAMSGGNVVLQDGTLMLVNSDASLYSDLSIAFSTAFYRESDKVSFSGALTDFGSQSPREYRIEAQPGAAGVDMRAVVNASTEAGGCQPQLTFAIVGPIALGDIDVSHGDATEHVGASENKSIPGAREILFNTGKTPLFDMMLPAGADVELKRQGPRRVVIVKFSSELAFGFAPESMTQKAAMQAMIAALKKSMQAKTWGDAEVKIKGLRDAYGEKFSEAHEEVQYDQSKVDETWRGVKTEIETAVQTLKEVKNTQAEKAARDCVDRHKLAWAGSEHMPELNTWLNQIEALSAQGKDTVHEAEAQNILNTAQAAAASGLYNVAASKIKVQILGNPVYAKTKVAEQAQALLQKYQEADEKKLQLKTIQDDLFRSISNYEKVGDYKKAAELIEQSADFLKNKDELPDVKAKLDDLKKKAQKS